MHERSDLRGVFFLILFLLVSVADLQVCCSCVHVLLRSGFAVVCVFSVCVVPLCEPVTRDRIRKDVRMFLRFEVGGLITVYN